MAPNVKNLACILQQLDCEQNTATLLSPKEEYAPPILTGDVDNSTRTSQPLDAIVPPLASDANDEQIDSDNYWDWPTEEQTLNEKSDHDACCVEPVHNDGIVTNNNKEDTNEDMNKSVLVVENESSSNKDTNPADDITTSSSSVEYWAERHYDDDINVKYFIDLSREIGRGTNSIVRKCINRKTGKRFAVKSVNKFRTRQLNSVKREAAILAEIDHPSIVKVHESYEDDRYFYVITDISKGGNLYERIQSKTKSWKKEKVFTEREVAIIIRQVMEAISYCHSKNIVHRDIKLENILLESKKKDDTRIKLIDFGLAKKHDSKKDDPMTAKEGTNYYVAPEVIDGSYTNACDLWSIGVVTYSLLSGKAPFRGPCIVEAFDAIQMDEEVDFPYDDWIDISESAKDFIRSLLKIDPSLRPSAAEAVLHEWLQVSENDKCMTSNDVPTIIQDNKHESRFQKMKKAFRMIPKKRNQG